MRHGCVGSDCFANSTDATQELLVECARKAAKRGDKEEQRHILTHLLDLGVPSGDYYLLYHTTLNCPTSMLRRCLTSAEHNPNFGTCAAHALGAGGNLSINPS